MTNKILVTGGCGFIGANFVRLLIKKTDYEVINFDSLTYAGNPENLRDIEDDPRYSFVKGDICDKNKVDEAPTLTGLPFLSFFVHLTDSVLFNQSRVNHHMINPKPAKDIYDDSMADSNKASKF